MKGIIKLIFTSCFCAALAITVFGQSNAGTIRGSVLDSSGGAIIGASVQLENPVSHYTRTVQTDSQGTFQFDNVPYNSYRVSVAAKGFQSAIQDVDVRSSVLSPRFLPRLAPLIATPNPHLVTAAPAARNNHRGSPARSLPTRGSRPPIGHARHSSRSRPRQSGKNGTGPISCLTGCHAPNK